MGSKNSLMFVNEAKKLLTEADAKLYDLLHIARTNKEKQAFFAISSCTHLSGID